MEKVARSVCQYADIAEVDAHRQDRASSVAAIEGAPAIRECFGRFHLHTVRLTYTVSEGGGKQAQELIVSNREVRMGLL